MRRLIAQIACAAWLCAPGCLIHRSHLWEAPSPAQRGAGPTVVLVGEAGANRRNTARAAEGVAQTLASERAAGREAVVVWLGDVLLDARGRTDCSAAPSAWDRPGVEALAEVVRDHVRAGGAAYSLPGEAAYRCGARQTLRADPRSPGEQPGVHFVVEVMPSGDTQVAARCEAGECSAISRSPDARVQLVFVDLTPWIAGRRPAETDADLRSLELLMDLLEQTPGPPRILVSNYPVEAAGYHGTGGGDPDSTVHTLAPAVARSLQRGTFVGAIAGHDRATYASSDISDGTIRGDRVFLPHPVFQVVSGAASHPNVRSTWRRLRFNSSIALLPERYTPRAGFALVELGDAPTATLRAHHAGRWQSTTVPLDLDPAPRPSLVEVPTTAPCLRCPQLPYNER